MEKRHSSDKLVIRKINNDDRRIWREQTAIELEIIEKNRDYPYFRDKILTGERALSAVEEGYFNRDILETIRQYNDYYLNLPDYENFSSNLRIHKYINSLIPLSFGREGNADYAEIRNEDSINGTKTFVVKTSKRPKSRGLIHEYFVGLVGTNKLRKYIPNFVYSMGFFQCPSPTRENGKITYCLKGEDSNYVIYENVSDGLNFIKFITGSTKPVFFNLVNQIIYSLAMINEQTGFIHGDLIPGNILIKRLPEDIQIEYIVNGKSTWIKTNIIATIIDYGSSIIEYGGDTYKGFSNIPMNGYYDVHTILMSLAYVITASTKSYSRDVIKYVKLFTDDDPYEYLSEGLNTQYKTRIVEDFSYPEFIELWQMNTPSFNFINDTPFEDVEIFGESETMEDYFIKDYSNPYYFVDSLNYKDIDYEVLDENYQHYIDFLDEDIKNAEDKPLLDEKIQLRELIINLYNS